MSTAGNWIVGHPFAHAKELNARLAALPVKDLPEGWVILDFGNVDLAKHIIDAN